MDLNFWKDLYKNYLREDAKIYFENNEKKINETAFRNSTLQGGYFLKAANALGLATGPMSGFFNKGVDEEFFKDTSIRSNFLCNIGYGDPTGTYDRAYRYEFDEVSEIL
jgi:3-hydroxypropanoate dehydrogenase